MKQQHFQTQVNRLAETFGAQAYKRERVELIWREVANFGEVWFTKAIDDFIGNCRHAPLLPEFREKISLERERGWIGEKAQHAKDAKDTWAGTLMPEESRIICQAIIARVQNRLCDDDWAAFMKGLNNMSAGSP